jgi:hypothetical protein
MAFSVDPTGDHPILIRLWQAALRLGLEHVIANLSPRHGNFR